MVHERGADFRVDGGLVSVQRRFLDDVLFDDRVDRLGLEFVHDEDDLHPVMKGTLLRLAGLANNEGLIGFHDAASAGNAANATERGQSAFAQRLTDAVGQEPRGLVLNH